MCSSDLHQQLTDGASRHHPRSSALTPDTAETLRVDYAEPYNYKPEGNHGIPVTSFKVEVFTEVQEVQVLRIDLLQEDVAGSFQMRLGDNSTTRCIELGAAAADLELRLEELNNVDGVSVAREDLTSTATATGMGGYVYTVVFDGPYMSRGGQPLLSVVPRNEDSCPDKMSVYWLDYAVSTLVEGALPAIPEIVEIRTTSSGVLGGTFDLSFDFQGDIAMALPGAATGTAKVDVAAGSTRVWSLEAANNFKDRVGRDDVVKIAGELHVVDLTAEYNNTMLPLTTYHQSGAAAVPIYYSDAILTQVNTTDNSATVGSEDDVRGLVALGEAVMLHDPLTGTQTFHTVVSFPSASAVELTPQVDTAARMTMYRRKKARVPHDASETDLKLALESLPGIGSVDVARFGPDKHAGYTWSVTFTSLDGPSRCPDGTCLVAEASTVRWADVTGCDLGDDVNGLYVEVNTTDGRPMYSLEGTPYHLKYAPARDTWIIFSEDAGEKNNVSTYVARSEAGTTSTAVPGSFDDAGIPSGWTNGCAVGVTRNGTGRRTLLGVDAKVETSIPRYGRAADYTVVAHASVLPAGTPETQRIRVHTAEDDLNGYYALSFAKSSERVVVKHDVTAKDLGAKLESLSTVGRVDVSREP